MSFGQKESRDYYETLEVERTASEAKVRDAFRKLAREYHPDVNPDNQEAERRFKEINEAYQVLGDPAKRRQYDEDCVQRARRAAQEKLLRRAAQEQALSAAREQALREAAQEQLLQRGAQEQLLRSTAQEEMLRRQEMEKVAREAKGSQKAGGRALGDCGHRGDHFSGRLGAHLLGLILES